MGPGILLDVPFASWSRQVIPIAWFVHVSLRCATDYRVLAATGFLAIRCVTIVVSNRIRALYSPTTQNVESCAFLIITFLTLRDALPPSTSLTSILLLAVIVLQKNLGNTTNYGRVAIGHMLALVLALATSVSPGPLQPYAPACLTSVDVATRVTCAAILATPLDAMNQATKTSRTVSAVIASLGAFCIIAFVDEMSPDKFTTSWYSSMYNSWTYVCTVTTLLVSPLPLNHLSSLNVLVMQLSIIFLAELLTSLCQTSLPALIVAALAVLLEMAWRAV